jgi:hypothetical protein
MDLSTWLKTFFSSEEPSPPDACSTDEASGSMAPAIELAGPDEVEQVQLALDEDDNSLLVGARAWDAYPADRMSYERSQLMRECLDAWRHDPLARRIVELTSQYVAGGGMTFTCTDAASQSFLESFWQHRHNRMDLRLSELSDELVRSGNLFILVSTDAAGMSYLRIVPSVNVIRIETRYWDIEQEESYLLHGQDGEEELYWAWDERKDSLRADGSFEPVILHYAVNRPAGAQWGESDLAPVLRWLKRYSHWLEDRVRLNHYRNAFMYVVKARFGSEAARKTRQAQLAANPPAPGSVLVTDENENWSVIAPGLEALDASTDGLAVKKMIAAGVGLPLHFLAEPESSTRTTAEAAGGPTYRRFEQRQHYLQWMVGDLLRMVLVRRARVDGRVDPEARISLHPADISSRDNRELAEAGSKVAALAASLYTQGLISRQEYLRIVYRFLGESLPQEEQAQPEAAKRKDKEETRHD